MVTGRQIRDSFGILARFYFLTTACTHDNSSRQALMLCALFCMHIMLQVSEFFKRQKDKGMPQDDGVTCRTVSTDAQRAASTAWSSSRDARVGHFRRMTLTCSKTSRISRRRGKYHKGRRGGDGAIRPQTPQKYRGSQRPFFSHRGKWEGEQRNDLTTLIKPHGLRQK